MACLNTSAFAQNAQPQTAAAATAATPAAAESALKERTLSEQARKAIADKLAAERAAPHPFTASAKSKEKDPGERKVQAAAAVAQNQQLKMDHAKINLIDLQVTTVSQNNPFRDAYVDMSKSALVNSGTSIFTDNLKTCLAIIARCYKDGVLTSWGICHANNVQGVKEAFLKDIKDRNFTRVEFSVVGGHENGQEDLEEIESTLKEFGFQKPSEVILNPCNVIDECFDEFMDVCNFVGFAVTAGITREGHVYYAYDSALTKFQPETMRTLNDFFIADAAKLQQLAERCKKDPSLKDFWLKCIPQIIADDEDAIALTNGFELFKGHLSIL